MGCYGGTLYYVAFPKTVSNAQDPRFSDTSEGDVLLMIYSGVDQEIRFTRPGGDSLTLSVQGGSMEQFDPSSFHALQNRTTSTI